MKINNTQQNITFKENIIIHFAERPRGDLRELAKKFAVAEKKIDSADNVGVALYVSDLKVLVLDKTVEISSLLRDAFYKVVDIGQQIKKRYATYKDNLDPVKIKPLKDKQNQARKEYDDILQKIVSSVETIEYTS